MVVAPILVAPLGLPVQSSLFSFVELNEQLVELTDDEGKYGNVQVAVHDVVSVAFPAQGRC